MSAHSFQTSLLASELLKGNVRDCSSHCANRQSRHGPWEVRSQCLNPTVREIFDFVGDSFLDQLGVCHGVLVLQSVQNRLNLDLNDLSFDRGGRVDDANQQIVVV